MDKEIFEIVSITDHEENPKLDGRYPLRIGRTCKKPEAKCGYRAVIEYLKNSDGSDYSDRYLLTSTVKEIFTIENTEKTIIIIETQNSRYKFLKVENNTEDKRMDKKSEETIMRAYCDNLDKVRHAGLLEGSTAILGAILEMCNSGASVGKIKKFCQDALKKTGKK